MPLQVGEKRKTEETLLIGVSISAGYAFGTLHRSFTLVQEPGSPITPDQVEGEITRFRKAVALSRKDLRDLQRNLQNEEEAFTILDSHLQLLDDPTITTRVEQRIRSSLLGTEAVFHQVVGELERHFSAIPSDLFRERFLDVKDLSQRILRHLCQKKEQLKRAVTNNQILWSDELMPSDVVTDGMLGFASRLGGRTSHAALLAKARGLPFVSGVDIEKEHEGKEILIDGEVGIVVLNPTEERKKEAQRRMKEKRKIGSRSHEKLQLYANIESLEDLQWLKELPIQGIGLVRSEFLFPHETLFTVGSEEQTAVYRKILEVAGDLPVNFRIFDVGADKRNGILEPNPALGMRGIRYHLHFSKFFKRQLTALFSAAGKELRILLPLIADQEEARMAKKIIYSVQREMQYKGDVKIGAMIELPSSAILTDLIAKECDFLSIGSNDLLQHTLACDRLSPYVSYSPIHESLLRMMKMILEKAGDLPVTLCGEIASNPEYTEELLAIGLEKFSCSINGLKTEWKTRN